MSDTPSDRAARRATWPGGVVRQPTAAQLPDAAARVLSMWQLALDAWAMQGKELPQYERSELPGVVIRRGALCVTGQRRWSGSRRAVSRPTAVGAGP